MKNNNYYIIFVALMGFASCFAPFQRGPQEADEFRLPTLALHKKATQKRLVTPPTSLTAAVIDYKKKYRTWPVDIAAACTDRTCIEEYKKFVDQGMEEVRIVYESPDSLLVNFTYSLDKHARAIGSTKTYYPNIIEGQYVFVSDSTLKLFTVLLKKDMKKLKKKS